MTLKTACVQTIMLKYRAKQYYACTRAHTCVCVCVCVCARAPVCMYVCMCMYICACVRARASVCVCVCMCVCVSVCVCVVVCVCVCVWGGGGVFVLVQRKSAYLICEGANDMQHIERLSRASVMLRATRYEGTAQLLSLTEVKSYLFELYFIG